MNVPILDLKAQYRAIQADIDAAIAEVMHSQHFILGPKVEKLGYATAIFRQVNKNEPLKHHDALEFPDGRIALLTKLSEGQEATVLQLPAQPTTAAEANAQKRIAHVG